MMPVFVPRLGFNARGLLLGPSISVVFLGTGTHTFDLKKGTHTFSLSEFRRFATNVKRQRFAGKLLA